MMENNINLNDIYNISCIEGMKLIEKESVDLVWADPPFSINFKVKKANYNRDSDLVIGQYDDINPNEYYQFSYDWLEQSKNILKNTGTIVVFSAYNRMVDILNAAEKLNLNLFNQIIWKFPFGMNATKKFISSHYNIFLFSKNEKKRNFYPYCRFSKDHKNEKGGSARYKDMESVFEINKEYWTGYKKIPTKLPLELCKKLISYTTKEGDLVVDNFSGTGQASWACKELNRNFIGFEIKKENYEFSKNRLDSNQYLIK